MPRRPKRIQEVDRIVRPHIYARVPNIQNPQIRLDIRSGDQQRDLSRLRIHL